MVRTSANGQPAVALYPVGADGRHRLHALHVLDLGSRGVARIVAFQDVDALGRFALSTLLAPQAQ